MIAKWFLKQRSAPDDELRAAHTESDKRGAAADHARLRPCTKLRISPP
ncbi:hypothetical protein [Amycolatopsis sp. WAC 04169]|nr:hypothetical protein [Amycolatopsis sp. WAC 04169]